MERNIGKHVAGSNVVIPDVGQLMKLMKVNIMITNGTVSYTHLDVYKRQVFCMYISTSTNTLRKLYDAIHFVHSSILILIICFPILFG